MRREGTYGIGEYLGLSYVALGRGSPSRHSGTSVALCLNQAFRYCRCRLLDG
jgi:hypothetical protein